MRQEYVHCHSKWFAKSTEEVLECLETDAARGLDAAEAAARLEEYGPNALPAKKRTPAWLRFLKHFHDILIYILFLAALVTLVLGHHADTVVIVIVAVINAAIGFFQENKAEKALDDIRGMLSPKASVLRGGKRDEIDAATLTLGDVVQLGPGDKIPADMRLAAASNLKVEESALTGEAVPADKITARLDPETMLGDRANMVFSGTTVSAGTGTGIVVAVGLETELGRISQLLEETESVATPLLRQMAAFGKGISFIIIGIAVAVYLFGHFFRDYPSTELLLSVIGLAIAAIPEGLPAILSIILAIGVQNMAKRRAIVRNLPSVETLGAVSVICSDKTGTLTRNEMTATDVATRYGDYAVTGSGYAPEGRMEPLGAPHKAGSETPDGMTEGTENGEIAAIPAVRELLRCFRLCNDAYLGKNEEDRWGIQGDPTEGALLTLFAKSGLPDPAERRVATLPFDSDYKYMAVLIEDEGRNVIYIKGAPDRLLAMAGEECGPAFDCDGAQPLDAAGLAHWEGELSRLAAKGRRVLGGAVKYVDASKRELSPDDLREGVIFLGLAGIVDPPRDEVIAAVAACHAAGIRVKMITGDHADTARAIGRELGIGDGAMAVTGRELDEMTPEQMESAVRKYDIFARTSPEHKLRLVKALQAGGAICAMTGDGVNDAPALRAADVGIAMGIKGTEVTKDSAEMVLADDNFSTIVAAVEEGRRVYDNLKKTILFILPTNGAESFLIMASIFFGTMLPLTPVQILWVNMVTSVTLSLALAFEKAEPNIMKRPPRKADEPLLSGYFIWRIFFVSVLIGGLTLALSVMLLKGGHDADTVRTIVLQTIVFTQAFHLFNSRSIRNPAWCGDVTGNKAVFVVVGLMLVLQMAVTYLPFMNTLFGTVPLSAGSWVWPVLLGALVFIIVEGEKALMRKIDQKKAA